MRYFICFLIMVFFTIFSPYCYGENNTILKTGITIEENLPDKFFGEWRVKANLLETNASGSFKKSNIDLWNISRNNSVITLDNPFSGAKASISIKEVRGNTIVFEKEGTYDNQILNDRVEITLNDDTFDGINIITLITLSEIDNHIMHTKTAKYSLYGDKISGENILVEE